MKPNGGFQRVFGTVLAVVIEPMTRNATIWSQSPVTTTANLQQTASTTALPTVSTALTTIQTASASVSALSSSTSQSSDTGKASASSRGPISSIVLGSALALLIMPLVVLYWLRKRRKPGNCASIICSRYINEAESYQSVFASAEDARPAPTKLLNSDRRPDLPLLDNKEDVWAANSLVGITALR